MDDSKNAIERLLELLDERGEHVIRDGYSVTWGYHIDPHTASESMDGTLIVTGLTPEQAIAATLGSGTCCLYYGEDDDGYDGWYCDECGGWFQAVWQDGHLVEPKHCQECGRAVER